MVPGEVSSTKPAEETNNPLETEGGLFVDTFRYFHPAQRGAYTNWCTVTSARQTNYGTRIDYIFADVGLVRKEFVDCEIKADIEGSDHCPVVATFRTCFQAALKPPGLCTKYMPEFAGRQQKLKTYFTKHVQQAQQKSQSQPETCSTTSKSQEMKTSLKRSASCDGEKAKTVKRQKSTGLKGKANGQSKTGLLSFFSRSSDSGASDKTVPEARVKRDDLDKAVSETALGFHTSKDSLGSNSDDSATENTTSLSGDKAVPDSNKDCPEKRKVEVALWKSILTGPRPPPLCSGHKEPCVLRTVKAKGPNQGRQFHCCARPQGHSSNPQARCSFFKWVK